jgi:hypothetical protein
MITARAASSPSRRAMPARGDSPATAMAADPTTVGDHLSALCSPVGRLSRERIVRAWEAAQGSDAATKPFRNTNLGETWVETGAMPAARLAPAARKHHRDGRLRRSAAAGAVPRTDGHQRPCGEGLRGLTRESRRRRDQALAADWGGACAGPGGVVRPGRGETEGSDRVSARMPLGRQIRGANRGSAAVGVQAARPSTSVTDRCARCDLTRPRSVARPSGR